MINIKKLFNSFCRAGEGLVRATKEEQNFRIQLIFSIMVLTAAMIFKIPLLGIAILILTISVLLILEVINSVIERFIDILKPRVHHYVAIVKDLMSAAVLIAGIATFIVTLLVFWQHLFND
jgi:diacylglycerol kinase